MNNTITNISDDNYNYDSFYENEFNEFFDVCNNLYNWETKQLQNNQERIKFKNILRTIGDIKPIDKTKNKIYENQVWKIKTIMVGNKEDDLDKIESKKKRRWKWNIIFFSFLLLYILIFFLFLLLFFFRKNNIK